MKKDKDRIDKFNLEVSDLKRNEQFICNHPIEKRASFKSHGKEFCWKCGKHI